ncbi:YfhO family protein, partial [Candidatus Sumerlaeota bacterium]|nr:YfhO family protein [Candidatus Sumerlaeota bacterium]
MTPFALELKKKPANSSSHIFFILSYFVLAAIYFNKLLFDSTRCISDPQTDVLLYFYPIRYFGFTSLSRGVLPLWNPHTFGGMPYQAISQTALFYPLNLFFLFLPTTLAINLTTYLHIVLSGCAAYFLARRMNRSACAAFLSGIAYAFCGQQILRLYAGHLTINAVLPWLPLFLLFLHNLFNAPRFSHIAAASFIFALAILAGHPQYVYYLMMASFVYWAFFVFLFHVKKESLLKSLGSIRWMIIPTILGILLSSIQILPTLAFTKESIRSEGLTREEAGSFSLPPKQIISFVAPAIFGSDKAGNYTGMGHEWEMTGYCGMITLLLALFALLSRERRIVIFYFILSILGLIIALGKYSPFFRVFYFILPGFRLFRGHVKALILTNLSLALLAGFGLDALVEKYFYTRIKRNLFTSAMIGVLILELGVFAFTRRSTTSFEFLNSIPVVKKNDYPETSFHRQLTLVTGRENSSLLSGTMDLSGYDSDQLLRYRNFINRTQGLPLKYYQLKTDFRKVSAGYLAPFGVQYVIASRNGDESSWQTHRFDGFQGLCRIMRKIKIVSTSNEALGEISKPDFDFTKNLVLETGENPPKPGDEPSTPDRVEIMEWRTNRIHIRAKAETPCYLLVSNVYARGWKARANGKPVSLYPA